MSTLEMATLVINKGVPIPPVTGGPLVNDVQRQFAADMHNAGFIVNWVTLLDGTHTPSVYGNRYLITKSTSIPLAYRSFGNDTVAWPSMT